MCSWSTGAHWHKVCQLAILNLFSPFFLQNSWFVLFQVNGTFPMPITMKLHTTLWMSEGEKRQSHHSISHFSFAHLFLCPQYYHSYISFCRYLGLCLANLANSWVLSFNDYIPCYFDSSKFSSKSFSFPNPPQQRQTWRSSFGWTQPWGSRDGQGVEINFRCMIMILYIYISLL